MWNLSYGNCGKVMQMGTRALPGHRRNHPKKHKGKKIPRKARQAYKLFQDLEAVPRSKRLQFLRNSMHKGAWISADLIAQRRAEFEETKRTLLPLPAKCYVCRKKAKHRHHVIPIFRGGSNANSNLVPLCLNCHRNIHPWLKENLSTAAGIIPATASDLEKTDPNHSVALGRPT